jgi:hypothetical protein
MKSQRNSTKSIIQEDTSICFLCGYPLYSTKDEHHIFNGAYRRKSDEDGLVCYLHRQCHTDLHDHPKKMKMLKRIGQRAWMKHYGKTLEEFMERYGKNYDDQRESGTDSQ